MRVNVFGLRGFPNIQGGVEKHCEEIYPRIKAHSFKIFRRKRYVHHDNSVKYDNIVFRDIPNFNNKYLETTVHSMRCAFETIKDRPDIVHIHNIGPALTLPLLKLFGMKCIVTYHSSNYEHSKWNFFARLFLRASEKLVFIFADRIIFVSKSKKESFPKVGFKSMWIPNGISTMNLSKHQLSLGNYKLKKGKYILAAGRLVPEKGFSYLINAFSKLKTDIKLVIAGGFDNDDSYAKHLIEMKKELGDRVVFTGFLKPSDLSLLYKNAYCFVLPSENEGMPMVLLESMSFGLCPLVSDIIENKEIIKENGFSFKSKDEEDLRKMLLHLINNPKLVKKIGSRCKKEVNSTYHWNDIAKQTEIAYEDVKNGK